MMCYGFLQLASYLLLQRYRLLSTAAIFLFCFHLLHALKFCYKMLGSVLWSTLNVVWTTIWGVFCMAASSGGKLQLIPQRSFHFSVCRAE